MASLDEFINQAQSDIAEVKEASTSIEKSKSIAEELSSQFQALSAETMASGSEQLKKLAEEAQHMLAPVVTKLEEAISTAESLKN